MTLRHKTPWRPLAKRFVVLCLATLAPAVASVRVPYRSKPRSDEPPATQAIVPIGAGTIASDRAPESATDGLGRPSHERGGEQATAGGTTPKPAPALGIPTNSATCSAVRGLPTLGTAVHWMPTPDEAGKQAEKERKLLFLIQVSGNFARQGFT